MARAVKTDADVIIVGGGWSGILACKHALEQGLEPLVLEKREGFGGVWRYSDDPEVVTVMKTTETTSSATVTEPSDFPMPEAFGHFPRHDQVLSHLGAYVRHFELGRCFRFGQPVEKLRRDDDGWLVDTPQQTYRARFVVVASGVHQTPNLGPMRDVFDRFEGELLHSAELKEVTDRFDGQRVLLYGGGETASDLAELIARRASSLTMAIPRGQHFFQKRVRRRPTLLSMLLGGREGDPLDTVGSVLLEMIAPLRESKPGYAFACRYTTGGSVAAYDGHGIAAWKAAAPFFHAFVNKNAAPVDLALEGALTPKRKVVSARGHRVTFCDGTSEDFDVVIACTGYSPDFSFLGRSFDVRDLYKQVFVPDDPTLAFVGLVRPVILSIPMLAEFQAKAVMRRWAGKWPHEPDVDEMRGEAKRDREHWAEYFKDTSQRLSPLVEPVTYIESLVQVMGGFEFNPLNFVLKHPRLTLLLLLHPLGAKHLLLDDARHAAWLLEHGRRRSTIGGWLALRRAAIALGARLLGVDVVTQALGSLRYIRAALRPPTRGLIGSGPGRRSPPASTRTVRPARTRGCAADRTRSPCKSGPSYRP